MLGAMKARKYFHNDEFFKVLLSPSKIVEYICFNGKSLKVMEKAFYVLLKALFLVNMFKF